MPPLSFPALVTGLFLCALAGSSSAQDPFLAEDLPVYEPGPGTWGPFPALKDMRSAWGDVDADGDWDVIFMGRGPTGPVTKLFLNKPPTGGHVFQFEAATAPTLPQLQDGALAWGDMDNDGKLDLAITGSNTDTPTATAHVFAYILRNSSITAQGAWSFTLETLPEPCFGGCLSWGDMDSDGDQDLFLSGIGGPNLWPLAGVFENLRGNLLKLPPAHFLTRSALHSLAGGGLTIEEIFDLFGEYATDETRRAEWTDVNKDGLTDLILITEELSDLGVKDFTQQVWINQGTGSVSRFRRAGDTAQSAHANVIIEFEPFFTGIDPQPPAWTPAAIESLFRSRVCGGVGDWDGDGWTDLAFIGPSEAIRFSGGNDHSLQGWSLRREPVAALPQDLIPGFSAHVPEVTMALTAVAGQTSADLLNTGRQQWLGSVITERGAQFLQLLSGDLTGNLAENFTINIGNVEARSGGVLDAVDVNRDGTLELIHSGYDEASDVATAFFANNRASHNTPPTAPGGLAAEASANRVHFHWNPASDTQTPAAALRYAIRLKNASGAYYVVPDARPDGKRLRPNLQGSLQTTDFTFNPYNAGRGRILPDGIYTWSVQSVDSGGLGSPFAPEQSFTVGNPDPNPPPPPPDSGERKADLPWRDAAIDLGDVDRDGLLDVVLAGKGENTSAATIIRRNDGPHPTLTDTIAFSVQGELPSIESGAVRWGDVDGDGDLDLAVSGRSSGQPYSAIYGNHLGSLTFRTPLDNVEYSALDWGDFDNDGDLDLVVTGYRDNAPHTRLYRNGGDLNQVPGTLVYQSSNLPDIGMGAAAWGDYDNDGDLDLLLCGNTAPINAAPVPCTLPPGPHSPGTTFMCANLNGAAPLFKTFLLRNDGLAAPGNWQFNPVYNELPAVFSYSGGRAMIARAEWCDMSGDGFPDLVLGGMAAVAGNPQFGTPTAKVYRNAGPGPALGEWAFVPGQELLDSVFDDALQTLTCADWNRDGWPDIMISGWLNGPGTVPTRVLMGNGGNYYTPEIIIKTGLLGSEPEFAGGLAAFGHFDGDANVDIVQSGRWGIQGSGGLGNYGTAGRVYLTPALPANLPPTPPSNLAATVSLSGAEVTFSWNPSADGIHVLKPTYNLHVERVDGQPGGMPGMANLTTGKRLVSRRGNVGQHRTWTLRNLPAGTYRWAVQGIDASLATSTFASAAQTFTVGPPVPAVIRPLPPWHAWSVGNPAPSAVENLSMAAGRRARLIAGRRGQLLLSRNREPFARVDSGVFTDLHDVIIDSEGAIAVGEAGVIRITSDGVVWTESPSGTTATLRAVARGDTGWVAGGDGVLLHSTNRQAWTSITIPAGTAVHDILWSGGRYVLVGGTSNTKVILTSTNGLTWTDVTPSGLLAGTLTGVASDGTKFIAVGGNTSVGPGGLTFHQDVLTSPTGLAWTVVTTPDLEPMTKIIRAGTAWLGVKNREMRRSLDGVVWDTVLFNSFALMNTVAAGEGLITMAGANGIIFDSLEGGLSATSTSSWTQRAGVAPAHANYASPNGIAVAGDTVVVVGSYSLNYVSQDGGRNWQGTAFGDSSGYYGLARGAGRFVRTRQTGIDHSTDGITWQSATLGDVRAITFGGDRFVTARNTGGFSYSTNGISWITPATTTLQTDSLAWGNGRFLALERLNGNVHSSPDGITWTQVGQIFASRLCFAKDRFFALSFGQTRTSPDGVTWTPVTGLPAGTALSQIIWHQNLFFAAGANGLLLTSPDALTWTSVPVPASGLITAIAEVNGGIVVAGAGHTILFAPDPTGSSAPAPPPVLSFTASPTPGVISLTITGRPGQIVTLERSADLSQWTAVQAFTLTGGTDVLQVPVLNSNPTDYFRLRWQP